MSVSSQHPDYSRALPRYKLVRAIINNDAKCYIRSPDPIDQARNKQYKDDAILTNFTNLTCEAFVGLVFSKKLKLSLPPELSYIMEDVTGTGINIWQFSQYSVSELLQTGRYGYLVDYDNDAGKAFIKPYCAEAIINWKVGSVNGYVQPWLIVLQEEVLIDEEDVFSQDVECQYRVLRLIDGVYYQQIYNANEDLVSSQMILNADGNPFDHIPFIFVGSENNDWEVDKQPLYDMSVINLGHYRNSADYEESIFICGQPYVHVDVGDSNIDEFNTANPNGVSYGSRKGLTTVHGRVDLIQANPNQLVAQAMNEKLEQASKIGARLIEPAGGRETAEAAKIRYSSQHSVLYTLTSNASWAIEDAIEELCEFVGVSDEAVRFKLNDQFYDDTADGNIMTAYTAWFDRGVVSANELREYGRKTGIIDEDAIDSDIENAVDLGTDPLMDFIDDDNSEGRNTQTPASINENGGNSGQED